MDVKKTEHACSLLLSLAAAGLGGMVIAGWHFQWHTVLYVFPGLVPMQYNTALSFLLLGTALLLTHNRKTAMLSIACAGLVVFLAALNAMQYFTGMDFGIDTLLFEPYLQTRTSHAGRMAPNTALCFILAGMAIICWQATRTQIVRLNIMTISAVAILLLSTLVLAGYLADIEAAYSWWGLSDMAVNTAAGFFISGWAMLFLTHPVSNKKSYNPVRQWMPAYAALGGIVITLLITQGILVYNKHQSESAISAETRQMAEMLSLKMRLNPDISPTQLVTPLDNTRFMYKIFNENGTLVYSSDGGAPRNTPWEISSSQMFDVNGVQWSVHVALDASTERRSGLVLLILVFGLLLSLLLAHALWQSSHAQRYRRQLESIVDNTVEGFITITDTGTVKSYNKACERIFGYKSHEVIGRNIKMLMPPKYSNHHDQYLKNYLQSGVGKIIGSGREIEGQRKNGSVFPADLSIAEVQLGTERVFSGIIRDISARKAAEENLRRSYEELEQFTYVASHDLKAPLRGIDNLASWISEDLAGVLTEDTQEKLTLMRNRVARLEKLLEDILRYSRVGHTEDTPEIVDLNALIHGMRDNMSANDHFEITAPALPVFMSYRTPLEQIFSNLITNAIKHHDRAAGHISINVSDAGYFYEFSVTDDGPGIPPAFHAKVFQMFQTLQPRDKREGSGIGMSIVKKLVEWQGGRVWVSTLNQDERGTSVHFLWPKTVMPESLAS